jgi:hypothetical protein
MAVPPISPPYQQTVGALAAMFGSTDVQPAGDPAKVAQVVLQVADLDEPPVRLLLGSDAVRYAAGVEQARAAEDARWRDLSVTTDRDDATAAELDPLSR